MITEIENFLTKEECDQLISNIEANNVRSSVAGSGSQASKTDSSRTSYTSNLDVNDSLTIEVKGRIASFLQQDLSKGEPIQGQKYEAGQFFRQHHDYFTGDSYTNHCLSSGNRTYTMMIYLNDDFEGGGTNFPSLDKTVEPKTGKAVFWENTKNGIPQHDTLHEGTDVVSGTKYIITSWWRENEWNGSEDVRLATEHHNRRPKSTDLKKVFSNHDNIPKFHETGFKVVKVPDDAWALIQEMYEDVKPTAREEVFEGKESIIPGTGKTSELLDVGQVYEKRDRLHQMLLPLHEEFARTKLEPSFIYGIRSYLRGAGLVAHKDRIATHHISSIIIVDKDLKCGCKNREFADDWPLDIQSHNGAWNQVYAEVGEMILYESAACEHARNYLFAGTYFRNMFVHYKLSDWQYVAE